MSLRPVNFMEPVRAPRRGWVLLALGLVALAGVNVYDQQVSAQRRAAEQARQAWAESRRVAQRPAVPSAQALAAERRQQAVDRELNRPWLAVLGAVEASVADPVYLLSLSVEPEAGTVKLQAEAPSFEQALAFVQALAARPGVSSAHLSSHEQVAAEAAPGGVPLVRFTVLAQWKAAR